MELLQHISQQKTFLSFFHVSETFGCLDSQVCSSLWSDGEVSSRSSQDYLTSQCETFQTQTSAVSGGEITSYRTIPLHLGLLIKLRIQSDGSYAESAASKSNGTLSQCLVNLCPEFIYSWATWRVWTVDSNIYCI